MTQRPDFIYFDLGNVLLEYDRHRAARQIADVSQMDPQVVWETLFEGPLHTEYELGRIDDRQFYEAFCARTGSRPSLADFQNAGCDIFDCNAAILPLVVHLEAAGHRLGILSNTNPGHWHYCSARFGIIPDAFEQTVLSYQVHVMKPDPEIYQIATARAGVAPRRILFIDDRAENVAGARRVGWQTVLYSSAVQLGRQLLELGVPCGY